jgi:archaellin
MRKWVKTWFARKKSITGLSAAIVMMAFVTVASVFAYTVVNLGYLATQKSQEVIVGGLQAATGAIVLDGPVYGYSNQEGSTANITTVIFWLKTASGVDSVDLNVNMTTIAFENARGVWPNIYNSGNHDLIYTLAGITYTAKYSGGKIACRIEWEAGSGMVLNRNGKVRVTIDLTALTAVSVKAGEVMKNEQFAVIVKPPLGPFLEIVRYAPAEVKAWNDLGLWRRAPRDMSYTSILPLPRSTPKRVLTYTLGCLVWCAHTQSDGSNYDARTKHGSQRGFQNPCGV